MATLNKAQIDFHLLAGKSVFVADLFPNIAKTG